MSKKREWRISIVSSQGDNMGTIFKDFEKPLEVGDTLHLKLKFSEDDIREGDFPVTKVNQVIEVATIRVD